MVFVGFLDEFIRHGVDESYGFVVISVDRIGIAYDVLISSYGRMLRKIGADYILDAAKFSVFLATIHKRLGLLKPEDVHKFVAPIVKSLSQYVYFRGILLGSETKPPGIYLDVGRMIDQD